MQAESKQLGVTRPRMLGEEKTLLGHETSSCSPRESSKRSAVRPEGRKQPHQKLSEQHWDGVGGPTLCLLWPHCFSPLLPGLLHHEASQGHGSRLWCRGMVMMKRRKMLNDSNCSQPLRGCMLQRGSGLGQGEG